MPINIIRQDITKIECDVIVNATSNYLTCATGVSAAIYEATHGEIGKYMRGVIDTGDVFVTPPCGLSCKYIFHVVDPVWRGGGFYEKELLALVYKNILKKAVELGASSVAIPLIASGVRGFPKELVLKIAEETIAEFLKNNELDVYIVVYDKRSFSIGEELSDKIAAYIKDNYEDEVRPYGANRRASRPKLRILREEPIPQDSDQALCPTYNAQEEPTDDGSKIIGESIVLDREWPKLMRRSPKREIAPLQNEEDAKGRNVTSDATKCDMSLDSYAPRIDKGISQAEGADYVANIKNILKDNMDETFAKKLLDLIAARHISDVEAYKKANVSKQTWHKIISDATYKPSKSTVIAFAIALELNLEETELLLATAGFALSRSIKFDLIIVYFISNGEYNIYKINDALYEFDQQLLGV